MHRRRFLSACALLTSQAATAGTGVASRALCGIFSYLLETSNRSHPGTPSPLPGELFIPPLTDPPTRNGVKYFNLTIQPATHRFFEGIDTPTYGINASYLGPTLYMRKGENVHITYTNTLHEATTMHGHGMHVPGSMDGGPHQIIPPGGTWTARYRVNQAASTNWYHPHLMGKTAEHVYMGLAGLIYVEDDTSQRLALPRRYSIDDIPLVLQDRRFDSNGNLHYAPTAMEIRRGYLGDVFLVNGVIDPYFVAEAGLLRLRILNGSNARVYRLALSNAQPFALIGGDNSLLAAPVWIEEITLSPGERAEIVVDLSQERGRNVSLTDLNSGRDIVQLRVNKPYTGTLRRLPSVLDASVRTPSLSGNYPLRRFTLDMRNRRMTINGKSMDKNRIDERVPLGQTEIWEVINTMGMNHNFHIHATHFRILERNGSASNVQPWERGYKDVVFMPPNSRVKLLVTMKDYKDPDAPYMYHCHFLEHEDDGMMGQFVVV